jgi:hypothetical protein
MTAETRPLSLDDVTHVADRVVRYTTKQAVALPARTDTQLGAVTGAWCVHPPRLPAALNQDLDCPRHRASDIAVSRDVFHP